MTVSYRPRRASVNAGVSGLAPAGLSGSKLNKARRGEIAVEGESVTQPVRAHQRKAGRIHERVLTFIVLAQPPQGRVLVTFLYQDDLDP